MRKHTGFCDFKVHLLTDIPARTEVDLRPGEFTVMGDPQREFDTVAFHSSGSFLGISVRIHQLHGEAARNHGRETRIIETGDRDLGR